MKVAALSRVAKMTLTKYFTCVTLKQKLGVAT